MAETQPTILFRDDVTGQVMLFAEPAEIIVARTRAEFFAGLARMEQAKAAGKWLAGYMAYEAGYLFEENSLPSPGNIATPRSSVSASSTLRSRIRIRLPSQNSASKTRNSSPPESRLGFPYI